MHSGIIGPVAMRQQEVAEVVLSLTLSAQTAVLDSIGR
jgi:hypothetical protein